MIKLGLFFIIYQLFLFILSYIIFRPIFVLTEVVVPYGIHPIDICYNSNLWNFIKLSFVFCYIFTIIVLSLKLLMFYIKFKYRTLIKSDSLVKYNNKLISLLIGYDADSKRNIYIPESGLFQNFLITGTIGTGKTSSAMYPFTEQILKYNSINNNNKFGILVLDVKGNYFKHIKQIAYKYHLSKDIIEIGLNSPTVYNPLHKPNLSPIVLANRLKTILLLFSENNSESYWLDKAEQILAECIKLCRLYNDGYVTFMEIHKLVTEPDYYKSKVAILRNMFYNSNFSYQEIYDLNSSITFFEKEFYSLDNRTLAILKSEITRITNIFVSDYRVSKAFCPPKEKLNFKGFNFALSKGKIVVLNMNIAEYKNLSKLISAYLKLDFQSEVMYNLSHNRVKPSVFICDEYAEYVTKTDADFFSLSREAKCINIVCTQSYSSLKNTLKDETTVKVIIQNLINKIWFRTDDTFTIEEAQKQLGKEFKTLTSTSYSEGAKETKFNYITKSLNSRYSNITESFNTYSQKDFVYDTNFFTQNLETFSALAFLSNGSKILKPLKLKMIPYFEK